MVPRRIGEERVLDERTILLHVRAVASRLISILFRATPDDVQAFLPRLRPYAVEDELRNAPFGKDAIVVFEPVRMPGKDDGVVPRQNGTQLAPIRVALPIPKQIPPRLRAERNRSAMGYDEEMARPCGFLYQLLDQRTDIVPLQFIAFNDNQAANDVVIENSTSQKKLGANVTAQIMAFACGKDDSDPNKTFAGNRPSSLIYGKQLTPKTLGALLAHYENKVMFQGFAWNLNSFDQQKISKIRFKRTGRRRAQSLHISA